MVKWSSPKAGKRWYNRSYTISRRSMRPIAMGLHTEMYSAFARGNVNALKAKCTEGIFESFRARIAGRKKGEVLKWELLKYNGSPKVVADRGALIPGMDGMAIRQAVVRIASKQRLTKEVGGKVVEGSEKSKDVLEYVVVQQKVHRWQVEGWKLWGTTKESTLEDVEEWKRRALSGHMTPLRSPDILTIDAI
ncbi:Inner membrane mitoribosome receptor [Hyphodiscus hymeniophilus]|uniref:Large ribosomal subunit protein mL45 n=1 Tax=Hyphodiscus hymeniophilus TaxID=353542 RepID=A0A9P7AYV0_9HELO|nr:Inner membrane mitoribosome receptor [Hyphodiscus hymeniophilus]